MHWYAAMRKAAEAIERETQEAGLEAPRGAPGGAHQAVGLEMLMATKWAKKFVQATSPGSEETAKDYLHRLKALMEAAAPVSASRRSADEPWAWDIGVKAVVRALEAFT